jgi:hypothetical protein
VTGTNLRGARRISSAAGRTHAKKFAPVRTTAAWEKLSSAQRRLHEHAVDIVGALRRDPQLSLSRLARERGIDPRTVRKYAGPAIQFAGRRYSATTRDPLFRRMQFFNMQGQRVTIDVTDSRTASKIGRYMNAVDHYLRTGSTDHLREFRGNAVRVRKVAYPFITHPRVLNRLANANEIGFEDLYARVS